MNWMRRKLQPSDLAMALARTVLPVPGTSSISRWPWQSSATSARRTSACLPTMTRSTFAATFSPDSRMVVTLDLVLVRPWWPHRAGPLAPDPDGASRGWYVLHGPRVGVRSSSIGRSGSGPSATALSGPRSPSAEDVGHDGPPSGTARWLPAPARSTTTAIAICGLLAGAKPMNQLCGSAGAELGGAALAGRLHARDSGTARVRAA